MLAVFLYPATQNGLKGFRVTNIKPNQLTTSLLLLNLSECIVSRAGIRAVVDQYVKSHSCQLDTGSPADPL
jgi:hypothetical protein